ncbi:hypothetical protein H310_10826 [Aphanomyces invadans]|uniref:Uncharacterized protein n=1 Tax=Aphanomyces invadans TaxID=157072 RepID=A0A024TNN9_9STRA|nr:hypothetical protein H310_10826 [Aphanomyces invadans]ETV95760.1 hypothetical protein H310_10826 [Aphanomyces invadans]|eukprot:XP_008875511.1 hypothetical protein H310_10826 [Aphanomyces invadans]
MWPCSSCAHFSSCVVKYTSRLRRRNRVGAWHTNSGSVVVASTSAVASSCATSFSSNGSGFPSAALLVAVGTSGVSSSCSGSLVARLSAVECLPPGKRHQPARPKHNARYRSHMTMRNSLMQ